MLSTLGGLQGVLAGWGAGGGRLHVHAAAGADHPLVGGRGAGARRRRRHRLRRLSRPRGPRGSIRSPPCGPNSSRAPRIGIRNVGEGVAIALDSLRANKLRSGLTILGVVIGVTTVMAIASMVQGIRTQIFNAIETAGPTVVLRRCGSSRRRRSTPTDLPYEVRIRPDRSSRTDAEAMARIPEIALRGHVGPAVPADGVPGQPHPDDHRLRRRRPLHGHPGRHAAPRPLLHPGRAERATR